MGLAQESLIIDKVIAKVGGEFILLSDVEGQYSYIKQNNPEVGEEAKCQILEGIIAQKLMVYQAKLDSLNVTDAEIESQLDYRFQNVLQQMNGDEDFFKEYYGASVEEMKNRMRDDQKEQILAERMQRGLITDVKITPAEVKTFYESIPLDSLPLLNAEVEVGELILKPKVNEQERMKSINLAKDLRKRILEDGEDFAELAKKYSQDPGSGAKGGDLGFAKRGTFVPEFEATAYLLEKNEISEPIETNFGTHIIQLIERRGNLIHCRHILIRPEITPADLEKTKNLIDSIKILVQSDSLSFEAAVKKYGFEEAQSYHNNGRLKNPATGNNFFETADLTPEIYFATEELEVGQISESIEFSSPTGETMYRIVQLQSKTRPHRASLKEDYSRIQNFAKESKKNIYLSEWLAKKYKETYITVDPLYGSCPALADWIQ